MRGINFKRDFLPHIGVLAFFAILTSIYFYPVFEGKVLSQHDMKQWRASVEETKEYNKSHEDVTRWTNSKFSGMPTYQMMGSLGKGNYIKPISMYVLNAFPENIGIIFMAMVGFYFLMVSLGFSIPVGIIAAIAFAFCTNNLVSMDAGHVTKLRAMAFGPLVLGSILLVFRKKRLLLGSALTAFFLAIQVSANHPQITYYLAMATGLYLIIELIQAFRNQELPYFGKAVSLLVLAAILGVGTHIQNLGTIYEYSKSSTRGFESPMDQGETNDESGLDRSYVFNWSYGIAETANLMIPNFMGGTSAKSFVQQQDSETFKALRSMRNQQNINRIARYTTQYWGQQPMTSGPIYLGAVTCFLFFLSLFLVRGPLKWWLLTMSILAIMLAWGKNFMAFNNLFYQFFPFYSKFRTVTMILYLVQFSFPFLGGIALKKVFYDKLDKVTIQSAVKKAFLITGGFCLIFALLPSAFLDFTAGNESTNFLRNNAPQVLEALKNDRASLLQADAFRSFIFITLAAGTLYLFAMNLFREKVGFLIIGALVIVDLWGVDKRYIHADKFQEKNEEAQFQKSFADQQILKDNDPHYRVFDLTSSPFNDATSAYYHKLIGGYHGAKMGRYQDLIEYQIQNQMRTIQRGMRNRGFVQRTNQGAVQSVINRNRAEQLTILNMLNMKYLIVPGKNQRALPIRNPANYGNAWFVRNVEEVANGRRVMKSLDTLDPKRTAVYPAQLSDYFKGFNLQYDPQGQIQLSEYEPNKLVYQSQANSPQFAAFSEVYYNDEKGWKVYIDGEQKAHTRVNYVLRGMKVPAGNHTITFKFEPETPRILGKVSLASSILILIWILGMAGYRFYNYAKEPETVEASSSKAPPAGKNASTKGKSHKK